MYAASGPTKEFEVNGDQSDLIELQNIYLEVKRTILRPIGHKLKVAATDS